jgi:signal transduction histidine kinase
MEPSDISDLDLGARPGLRRGLWAETAVTMAAGAVGMVLLNAALFWLLGTQLELERRQELTLASASGLAAQLGMAQNAQQQQEILGAYSAPGLNLEQLWLQSGNGDVVVEVGAWPETPDAGLKAALNMEREHVEVQRRQHVQVTVPVNGGGALRMQVGLDGHGMVSPGLGLVLSFSLGSGMVLALGGFVLVRRRLILPIQEITATTERIAGGAFGHTSELKAARELGDLAGALNVLSVSLAGYRARTRAQVSDLEQANQELRAAQEELIRAARLASVGALAAGIAHEVGNPLAAVVGYVELLADGVGDEGLEKDLLARTQKEVGRIHGIIRELLDYARPKPGRRVERSPQEVLQDALDTVLPLPGFREIELRAEAAPELPLVVEEEGRLHQVLLNLLLNARDALDGPGEVRLQAVLQEDGLLRFSCIDSGPGFSEQVLDQVFEPFVSTKAAGKGTGLGLATCQRIVELGGGQIQALNRPEGGAELRFTWPAAD